MILIITVTVQKCELMWTKGNRYQHLNYELFVLIVPVNLPFFLNLFTTQSFLHQC